MLVPSSTSSDSVATVMTPLSRTGLSRVPADSTLRTIAPMNCCWRWMRSMSPLGKPLRCRTKASAWSPWMTWRPAGRSMPESFS